MNKSYPIELEISGHTAMWTRPDTGDAPVSYLAPTYSAAKGILESVCWLKSALVRPTRIEICSPPVWHTYTTNYGGPLRKSSSVQQGNSFQLLATAVMAHLLRVAADHGMRRVFVVLPYTNIIVQSVDVYRKCLVLPNEDPEQTIAAHHHRAEFSDVHSRHLTYRWDAPIVVTTAVQFFETLAAARTGALRKLHQLTNSAIFIDEAHAALPAHLWPVAWRWLQQLQAEWNCHIVMGSGSLSRFWTLKEFSNPPVELPNLIDADLSEASTNYETTRVRFVTNPRPLALEDLVNWVSEIEGPRLLIANSHTEIAVVKKKLKQRLVNREKVSFQELQDGSVQIYSNRKIEFALAPIVESPGVFEWTLDYDTFIGYMAGVIDNVALLNAGAAIA